MELVLGTVQFGPRYGVSGRGEAVPEHEVEQILQRAADLRIRLLDTAAAYGDIEVRLARLIGDLPLRVVSKLPPLPSDIPTNGLAAWIHAEWRSRIERLGDRLAAVLFHRVDDLLGPSADLLWSAIEAWRVRSGDGVAFGASVYQVAELRALSSRFPIDIVQAPGNALDQGLMSLTAAEAPSALHIRSAFLQGLLLMPRDAAIARVPASAGALARWHRWCLERALDPLVAALSVVQAIPGATHCVVGVDRLEQLESIAEAWARARPTVAPELATGDVAVIDPRTWKVVA
jgi:aryl-alcohol dehydrogenase-like predicted oxidoreductase